MGLLNETQIRAAKPGPKEYMLNDGDNLYLRVRDTGKAWIYRYTKDSKRIKLGLGPYPEATLAQARDKAYKANSQRANGLDPKETREQEEEQARLARLHTFELLARAWHSSAKKDTRWSDDYGLKVMRHLEIHVFPWVGHKPIETILPTEIVQCLHRPKDRGSLETAQRVREVVQHVYQYAVDIGALEPAKNFVNKNTGGLATRSLTVHPPIDDRRHRANLKKQRTQRLQKSNRCAMQM